MGIKHPLFRNILTMIIGYIIVTVVIFASMIRLYATIWVFMYYVVPFISLLYIIIGRYFKSSDSKKDFLIPIILLWVWLLAAWIISYSADPRVNLLTGTYDSNLEVYGIANPAVIMAFIAIRDFIYDGSKTMSDVLGLISTAIPPFFIWLGVRKKKVKEQITRGNL